MKRSMTDQYTHLADDAFLDGADLGPSASFTSTMPTNQAASPPSVRSTYGDHQDQASNPPPQPSSTSTTATTTALPPIDHPETQPSVSESLRKFKRVAQHVIHAQHIAKQGCSQGVDVSVMDDVYGCIKRQVDISVVDTSPTQHWARSNMTNAQFLEWLKKPRPEWSQVRWINVNGMSWDIIKALALHYDLHHLAVEDMLHVPQRTKVDAYPNQTFVSCTMLSLLEEMDDGERRPVSPHGGMAGLEPAQLSQRIPLEHLDRYRRFYRPPQAHDAGGDLKVLMEQVTMFLLPQNTLLSLFQVSGHTLVAPLMDRLRDEGGQVSMVRRHSDASFLLQSVLDGVVDHAIPITDAFRLEINDREQHVLAMPAMRYMRGLHRLSRQLSLLRRTVVPTQSLVATLRKKDEQRNPLSPLARTYLGDVLDHCNSMVEEIDTMQALCVNLIDLIFNIISFETNEYMKRLAIVSIIFLPVTFVAGVYGTNFEHFQELQYGISYFWKICLGCTCVVLGALIIGWLRGQIKAYYVKRHFLRHDPVSIESRHRRFNFGCND